MEKKRLKTEKQGRILVLMEMAGSGGEGTVYRAHDDRTGEILAVKLFSDKFKTKNTIDRIKYLTAQDLQAQNPVLFAPFDTLVDGVVGHVSKWAEGIPLEELVKNADLSLLEAIQLCIAIAQGIGKLHEMGIAYGDIQSLNIKVFRDGSVLKVALYDFDNYRGLTVPPPPMIGQHLYMAPELREGTNTTPDIGSDKYEMTVLFHEILFLRHPAAGYDTTEEGFLKAMCSGTWMQDRSRNLTDGSTLGGYPVTILNPELEDLFRRGLRRDVSIRPSAWEWKERLLKAMDKVSMCPHCGVQFIVNSGKVVCPMCRQPFPTLHLRYQGKQIPLDNGAVRVGRDDLGDMPKVSRVHAIFRKRGPDTWMRAVGSNPTYRWGGGSWIHMKNDADLLVQKGDRLRLADVEVEIV